MRGFLTFGLLGVGLVLTIQSPDSRAAAVTAPAYGPRDLNGMWVLDQPPTAKIDPASVPLTDAALAKATEIARNQAAGHLLSEGHIRCLPDGMPHMMAAPFGIEFLQTKNRITILAEVSVLPRTILLDRAAHTADLDPSWNGESIGAWNGNVLTVDTKGFNDRFANLFNAGIAAVRTPALHITEKFRLTESGKFMEDIMTLDDPNVFTHPFTITYRYRRLPETDVPIEYVCDVDRAQLDALEDQQHPAAAQHY
jgi:hypothetical protein